MEKRIINPWTWQDEFGFAQANEVTGANRVLFCSGQASIDSDGNAMHPGDMRAQVNQALDNLETVLKEAGMDFSNIVRLNEYTTDMEAWFAAHDVIDSRLGNCRFASTLLGVTRLAIPELLVELEATAVS